MDETIKEAVLKLAKKAEECKADEVLKYSQAALNLAHVRHVLKEVKG